MQKAAPMATIRVDTVIANEPDAVWDVIRDFGAVASRLVPDQVLSSHAADGSREITLVSGTTVREILVTCDDEERRLVYSAVGGRATHHNAAMTVTAADGATVLSWVTDVLPSEMEGPVRTLMTRWSGSMMRSLAASGAKPTPIGEPS
jgi:carbon monoxide dehydrogenase subunit G